METRAYFQAGGAVASTAPYYVHRRFELYAFDAIIKRRYVSILGPRQVGKTSLLYKLQAQLEQRAIPCAVIDLSALEGAGDAVRQQRAAMSESEIALRWYPALASRIIEELEPNTSSSADVSDLTSFNQFLNNLTVLENPSIHPVIVFDEAAAVPIALRTSFYMRLRSLLNSRAGSRIEPAAHIDFVFGGAFNPGALITDTSISPFNVSTELFVPDFTRSEVERLLGGFAHLGLDLAEGSADAIWDAAGGHPFLTQKICEKLAFECEERITVDDVHAAVETILDRDAHLENLRRTLDQSPVELEFIRRVMVRQEKLPLSMIINEQAAQLEMIGALTKGPDGFARVRNSIYATFLRRYFLDRADA